MEGFTRTVFLSALVYVVALLAFAVWWNITDEKDKRSSSASGEQEAPGTAPQDESRGSPGAWRRWSFLTGKQEPPAEKASDWDPREVEEAVRRTFLAYNAQDLPAFKAGWTDRGFQQAFERPKEKVRDFGLLSLLSFRPYTVGEFSNTLVDGKSAATEVELTYGEVRESHRMTLVREDDSWKIDHDEKLNLIPRDAIAVDAKLKFFMIELGQTRLPPGTVAFKIINADTQEHEFIVKRVTPSESEETVGKTKPLKPGENETLILTNLDPGRYLALCNMISRDGVPYSYGMRADFLVE